ncbi:MAG: hypothetical protein IJ133_06890 [Clostridia bacterium]|nr:hypothetical protein [Clostridia bacterium]
MTLLLLLSGLALPAAAEDGKTLTPADFKLAEYKLDLTGKDFQYTGLNGYYANTTFTKTSGFRKDSEQAATILTTQYPDYQAYARALVQNGAAMGDFILFYRIVPEDITAANHRGVKIGSRKSQVVRAYGPGNEVAVNGLNCLCYSTQDGAYAILFILDSKDKVYNIMWCTGQPSK